MKALEKEKDLQIDRNLLESKQINLYQFYNELRNIVKFDAII